MKSATYAILNYPLFLADAHSKNAFRYPISNNAPAANDKIRTGYEYKRGISITPSKLPIAMRVIVPDPNTSRISAIRVTASKNPTPIPIASRKESKTEFLFAKASALPRIIQLTTINGRKIPRAL